MRVGFVHGLFLVRFALSKNVCIDLLNTSESNQIVIFGLIDFLNAFLNSSTSSLVQFLNPYAESFPSSNTQNSIRSTTCVCVIPF